MEVGCKFILKFNNMIQEINKPARTITHEVEMMNFNIKDSQAVTCHVDIELRDGVLKSRTKTLINVNDLIAAKITSGDITTANANGFKKCMKLICSETLGLTLAETNDLIV